MAGKRRRFAALQQFWPNAEFADWELEIGGQRAQLVTPSGRGGQLQAGTDLVVSGSGTIAGLLGASPGASTAVSIMADLLRRTHSAETDARLARILASDDVTASLTTLGLNDRN